MNTDPAMAIVRLAVASLPAGQEAWGAAMIAELEEMDSAMRRLSFASGCLLTAWRALPMHCAGRFQLACWAIAIGVLIPFATFHLGCALSGLRLSIAGRDPFHDMLASGSPVQRQAAISYASTAPLQTALLAALAGAHLVAAWHLVDWRVRRLGGAIVAAALAATLLSGTIWYVLGDGTGVAVQWAAVAVELSSLATLGIWKRRRWT